MFERDDKRKLYWLIEQYIAGKITDRVFCDEYYYCYSLDLDYTTLTDLEKDVFADLSRVASRFSEFKEDHLALPNGFYAKEELKQKIFETKETLRERSPI